MSKETQIRQECCDIWNKLKDKTKMIDYLIEYKRQIADLEAKLAESEKKILELQEDSIRDNQIYNEQLAEKEKEIEKWKTKWCDSENNSLRLYEQNQNKNQDKISFCIEQLEKVKEAERLVIDEYGIANWYVKVYEIDQQINELKEKK